MVRGRVRVETWDAAQQEEGSRACSEDAAPTKNRIRNNGYLTNQNAARRPQTRPGTTPLATGTTRAGATQPGKPPAGEGCFWLGKRSQSAEGGIKRVL